MSTTTIPQELTSRRQWVVWRYETKPGAEKPTKVPYQVNGNPASSTAPRTWNTFDAVSSAEGFDGIGYVLSPEDPFVGVDLDDCVGAAGVDSWALDIIDDFDSYTEITPSGTGLRVFCTGALPGSGHRKKLDALGAAVEIYDRGRFLTLTGLSVGKKPIRDAQGAIDRLHATFWPPKPAVEYKPNGGTGAEGSDADLLELMFSSTNGAKARALYGGSLAGYEDDHSGADLALVNLIAFFAGPDPSRIDSIFRTSGLMREKWDERRNATTYGWQTVNKALADKTEFYQASTPLEIGHLPRAEGRKPWKPGEAGLPVIVTTNRQDRQIADESWEAMLAQNDPPATFSRGVGIARVGYDADAHRAVVEPIDEQRLLHRMRRVADYVTLRAARKEGEEPSTSHTPPPSRIAKDMLVDADRISRLPSLRGIVYAPVIGPSGVIVAKPGYDPLSRLWIECERVAVKHDATQADAIAAAKRLFDPGGVFGEFPFATPTDRAHFAAMVLTPYLRPYINSTAPMFITEAPERGTGKSLAVRNAIRLFDPIPRAWNAPTARDAKDAEAEWDKLLGTALKSGVSSLFFDNVRGQLVSTALEGLTTSTDPWSTRLLGSSTEIVVWPELLTIFATSNNTEANRDMARRSLIIRLDANMERPETRQGFAIADLDAHVTANRLEILADIFTIFAAWINSGRPEWSERSKGTYERWARMVGGILHMIGISDFLNEEEDRLSTMDPETQRWSAFVTMWHQAHGEKFAYARDLVPQAEHAEIIADALDRGAPRRLGRMIAQNRDRVIAGWQIKVDENKDTKMLRFILKKPKSTGFTGFTGLVYPATHDPLQKEDCNNRVCNGPAYGYPGNPVNPVNPVNETPEEGLF